MPYPISSEVSAGQPTASAHYNNLRNDALYLGMGSENTAALGTLLGRYEEGLRLELLETDRVRVPASQEYPVQLVVSGAMLCSTINVDLSTGSKPGGSAAQYYVFAVRSALSQTFSLDVNTTSTESTDRRRIGGFYWNGAKIESSSIYTERRDYLLSNLGMKSRMVFNGRLTVASGNPAPLAVYSSGTVYYTPYQGNRVSVYGHGLGWKEHTFDELSVSLTGLPANRPADVFLWDDAGTLKLETSAWASSNARAVALSTQDGVQVKSGDPTRVYLGSVAMVGTSGVSCDSPYLRYVWNMYNRVQRILHYEMGDNSWTYSTSSWRPAHGDTVNQIGLVAGLAVEGIEVTAALMMQSTSANNAGVGIGANSSSINHALIRAQHASSGIGPAIAKHVEQVPVGINIYYMLEYGAANVTFYGSNGGSDALRGGMSACFMM